MEHLICGIEAGSPAERAGIEAGDVLLTANGEVIRDVFDFRTQTEEARVELLLRRKSGAEEAVTIEKDFYEDLGLIFENDLMSDYQSCSNKCIFCFIDQMPPGMRETLYFKDDDSRLSFLQGNYITMTNLRQEDVDRIIRYRLEPMNISVHATDPELRCRMLKNRFAGNVLSYLQDFHRAGLHMNGQIVMCKGFNDGEQLERTIRDLYEFAPVMQSLSVVPVGLTRYREGLEPLEPIGQEDALRTIEIIERWQKKAFQEKRTHFVHASDEFYITAGLPFPEEERYDGYLQIENGVGMARSLLTEAEEEIRKELKNKTIDRSKGGKRKYGKKSADAPVKSEKTVFATGLLAAPILRQVAEMASEKLTKRVNTVYEIRNDFFGEKVTVAGLVTGQDLLSELRGKDLGDLLLIPSCMLRSGERVFLDDLTIDEISAELKVRVEALKPDGSSLVRAMTGSLTEADLTTAHGKYEPDTQRRNI